MGIHTGKKRDNKGKREDKRKHFPLRVKINVSIKEKKIFHQGKKDSLSKEKRFSTEGYFLFRDSELMFKDLEHIFRVSEHKFKVFEYKKLLGEKRFSPKGKNKKT